VLTKILPDSSTVSSTYTYTYDKVGNLLDELSNCQVNSGILAKLLYFPVSGGYCLV
jgi:hypothetical protein